MVGCNWTHFVLVESMYHNKKFGFGVWGFQNPIFFFWACHNVESRVTSHSHTFAESSSRSHSRRLELLHWARDVTWHEVTRRYDGGHRWCRSSRREGVQRSKVHSQQLKKFFFIFDYYLASFFLLLFRSVIIIFIQKSTFVFCFKFLVFGFIRGIFASKT